MHGVAYGRIRMHGGSSLKGMLEYIVIEVKEITFDGEDSILFVRYNCHCVHVETLECCPTTDVDLVGDSMVDHVQTGAGCTIKGHNTHACGYKGIPLAQPSYL